MSDIAHPLFPNDNDEAPPEIGFIHVIRHEPSGRKIQYPKAFQPDELVSHEQIVAMFGGGNYELVARDFGNKISRRTRIQLDGKSKSMALNPDVEDDDDDEEPEAKATVVQPPALSEGILGIIMHSSTQQMQLMQENSRQQQEASRQQMQLMLAMLQREPKQDNLVPLLGILGPMIMEAIKMLAASKGDKVGTKEILDFIQLGVELRGGAAEATKAAAGDDWMSTAKQFIDALNAGKAVGPIGPGQFPPAQQEQFQPDQFPEVSQQPVPIRVQRRRVVTVAPPTQRHPESTHEEIDPNAEHKSGTGQ